MSEHDCAVSSTASAKHTNIFVPYKALGLICGERVPVVLRAHGGGLKRDPVLLAAVGNVVHQYNARTLRLTSVSDCLPAPISALCVTRTLTFAGCGNIVYALRNNRQVMAKYSMNVGSTVRHMLVLGDHLLAVDHQSNFYVWDVYSTELYGNMQMDVATMHITAMCHPHTYVNKIVLGSEQVRARVWSSERVQGTVRLLNVRRLSVVHEFIQLVPAAITFIAQSPVVDVLAFGAANGAILVHNIRLNITLLRCIHDHARPITAIAFRTDGPPVMITASGTLHNTAHTNSTFDEQQISTHTDGDNEPGGTLAIWDLERQTLLGQMTSAHRAGIHTVIALHSESIIITAGGDNALRSWTFDAPDGLARLLVERDGPSRPATWCRFHSGVNDPTSGEMVLMSSEDASLREYSVWRETKQFSFGIAGRVRHAVAKKRKITDNRLPFMTRFSVNSARELHWDNVVCVHKDSALASTWSSHRRRLGAHRLQHGRFERYRSLSTGCLLDSALSACGNVCALAYSTGHVDMYNVQSARFIGTLNAQPTDAGDNDEMRRAHNSPVTAVLFDTLNRYVITGDSQGVLRFWNMQTRRLLKTVPTLTAGVLRMCLNPANDLLAVALADACVLVADIDTMNVVRRVHTGHTDALTDICFASDGHWLITVSLDRTLRVWQLSTLALLDCVRFERACLCVHASPSNEYIVTVHKGCRGVYVWANRCVYELEGRAAAQPLPHDYMPTQVTPLPLSCVAVDTRQQMVEASAAAAPDTNTDVEHEEDTNDANTIKSEESMSSTEEEENTNISNVPIESKFAEHADLVTLSGLPLSRWAQLPFMDAIRERNRPIEPVHKPKHAPFFLPTTSTLTGFEFDLDDDTTKQQGQLSRLIERKADALLPHTPFARQLDALSLDADILALDEQQREMFDACFDALKQMTPSGVDMELRQLRIDDDAVSARSAYITSVQAIKFVRMINVRTTRGIDYELCSAYMAAFVRIHRLDLCTAADTLTIALHECRHALHSRWLHVDALCARTLGIVQWLKSATV